MEPTDTLQQPKGQAMNEMAPSTYLIHYQHQVSHKCPRTEYFAKVALSVPSPKELLLIAPTGHLLIEVYIWSLIIEQFKTLLEDGVLSPECALSMDEMKN